MRIIVDNRIPQEAIRKLKEFGEVLFFKTHEITYSAISGHPDIFFCQLGDQLIVALNTPKVYQDLLISKSIPFISGETAVGQQYPFTSFYNAVTTEKYLIHHKKYTDEIIKQYSENKEYIHVNQAYTRCNLIPLKNNRFITTDKGIEKVLLNEGLETLYVNPVGIMLPEFENGFVGGTCGIFKNRIFFIGNLDYFSEGNKVRAFISDYEIIELYEGPLFDGGSLIFIE